VHGSQRIVLVGLRRAEDRHDGVAHVLVHVSAVLLDDVTELAEQLVDDPLDRFRIISLRTGCKPRAVGEHHGERAPLLVGELCRLDLEFGPAITAEGQLEVRWPLGATVRTDRLLFAHCQLRSRVSLSLGDAVAH